MQAKPARIADLPVLTIPPFPSSGAPNEGRPGGFFSYSLEGLSDEAHVPAQQSRPQAPSRLPLAYGDGGWPQGPERAPRAWSQEALRLTILKKRADFLAANRGRRAPMTGFVLLVRDREDEDATMRIGFTVSKKNGNAVTRNRIKRRFRALGRDLLEAHGIAGADHVLIGRPEAATRDYATMKAELEKALAKVKR